MKNNRAFWKALHSLTHPLSITAILLLLFNDHWLRHNYPSWLTGKLGDFTWLLFAPFIAALLFSLIISQKTEKHSKTVGLLSIAFIGIWFATAKTIPAIHWLTTETLSAIVGYRGTLRMDVTDLLTLPALFLSWHIWKTSSETRVNLKPIGYVVFGLAILGTMANSPGINVYPAGIISICEIENSNLIASTQHYEGIGFISVSEIIESSTASHTSYDGGLNWVEYTGIPETVLCSSIEESYTINSANSDIHYRWVQGAYIEKSLDGGESWIQIHNLSELKLEIRDYSNSVKFGNNIAELGFSQILPASGIVHSETGNLVLAMGTEGILVITPNNDSHWIAVGDFQLLNLQNPELINKALALHYYLLPTLWFLVLVTTIVIIDSSWNLTKVWSIVGWIHWILLVISANSVTIPPDIFGSVQRSANGFYWGLSALVSLFLIALPMVIWAISNLGTRYRSAFLPILVSVILASAGYMLPLILWTQGLIPRYYVASIFSILLTGCVLWACYTHYRDKLPARYEPPKEKRKPKEV